MYNLTLGRFCIKAVVVEKQNALHVLSVYILVLFIRYMRHVILSSVASLTVQ